MNITMAYGRYELFVELGNSGKMEAVDYLMDALVLSDDLSTSRLVDFALSLVSGREGVLRLRHYLFNGTLIQRNYAALYFKRRGFKDVLDEAVQGGLIDQAQAYAW